MKKPSLSLEGMHITELEISTVPGYDEERPADEVTNKVGFRTDRHTEDESRLRILFDLTTERTSAQDNVPYVLHVRCIAYFQLDTAVPEVIDGRLVANALTIVYGSVRGALLQTTGIFPYGSVLLPTVLMSEVVATAGQAPAKIFDDSPVRANLLTTKTRKRPSKAISSPKRSSRKK